MSFTILVWIAVSLLGLIFLALALFNAWSMVIQVTRPGQPHVSPAPLVGGVAGMIAVLLLPIGSISQRLLFAPLPLILDLGCALYFIGGLWCIFREKK